MSIKMMYHNVGGYGLNNDPVGDRADIALSIYQKEKPEIICFQEMTGNKTDSTANYRNETRTQNLMNWLKENYIEICEEQSGKALENDGGTPTPIFYRNDAGLTCLDKGYIRARGVATKGTTWAVFRTEDGNTFCVTDSHFVAVGEGGKSEKDLRPYRMDDANAWLETKLPDVLEKYGNIPVISGGDFNSEKAYSNVVVGAETAVTPYQLFEAKGYTEIGHGLHANSAVLDHLMVLNQGELKIKFTLPITKPAGADLAACKEIWGSDHAPYYVTVEFSQN